MKIRLKKKASVSSVKTTAKTKENPGIAPQKSRKPLLPAALKDDRKTPKIVYPAPRRCDVLMACRYVYYCLGHAVISDAQYDALEKVYLKNKLYHKQRESLRGKELRYAGSDRKEDYTPAERALGLYFMLAFTQTNKT